MSGANNPYWGKQHSPEVREKIAAHKPARPPGSKRTGPPKGYKHTPEARKKMSDAVRERWRTNRDKMLANLPRGENHPWHKTDRERRYRLNFTEVQCREWIADKCFYCGTTDDLVLDHIIPVAAGGKRLRANAQTLCGPCNRWKSWFVDRPYHLAVLGSEEG